MERRNLDWPLPMSQASKLRSGLPSHLRFQWDVERVDAAFVEEMSTGSVHKALPWGGDQGGGPQMYPAKGHVVQVLSSIMIAFSALGMTSTWMSHELVAQQASALLGWPKGNRVAKVPSCLDTEVDPSKRG